MLKYIINTLTKKLCLGLSKTGGRNIQGRICVRGRGGGNKKLYRLVDFCRRVNSYGVLLKSLYDTNRSCFLGLVLYDNGISSYINLSHKTTREIYSGLHPLEKEFSNGWAVTLNKIKLFTPVNNIEIKPYKGSKLVRSAGCSALLIGKDKKNAVVKLKSGWQVKVPLLCMATVGCVSNPYYKLVNLNNAGKKRSLGFRPKSRGLAKNPCDHPHGGGNGKKSAPPVPVNFTGRVKKWEHTKNKKLDIIKRRKFLSI